VPNVSQADADGDGIGNTCDLCVNVPDALQKDEDDDGRGDACDNCIDTPNAAQANRDADLFGDDCDNCPDDYSSGQTDRDGDGTGDRCDVDDGWNELLLDGATTLSWQAEPGDIAWNVYRGSLALLLELGLYTQEPALDPLAGRQCGLATTSAIDPVVPQADAVAFVLVTAVAASGEGSLGQDSSGVHRPNASPCP
jgi:hypothetical protein